MFVVILKYKKPLEDVERVGPAHREFLDRYYAKGNFIVSGRQNPPVGGMIICNASSREEVEAITKEDPFNTEGIADYTIVEFNPTKHARDFAPFLES
ncbi:MAG TPA: YciI family protein [Armatimonadota bacterium]|jgi:uncharacterized protein YciI